MPTQRTLTTISLPPKLLREARILSKEEGRTKSELFREALRRYIFETKLRKLQRYGYSQAQELGIKESDIPKIIAEFRSEKSRKK